MNGDFFCIFTVDDGCTVQSGRDKIIRMHILRTGNNLIGALFAAIDLANKHVIGIRMTLHRRNTPDKNAGYIRIERIFFFHFQTAGEEFFLDSLIVNAAQIHNVAQPTDR